MNQQVFSILHQFSINWKGKGYDLCGVLLGKMMEYAVEHSEWGRFGEEEEEILFVEKREDLANNSNVTAIDTLTTQPPTYTSHSTQSISQIQQTRNRAYSQYTGMVPMQQRPRERQGQRQVQRQSICDGIVEDCDGIVEECDGIVEDYDDELEEEEDEEENGSFRIVEELKDCMSETSLTFLSHHQLPPFPPCSPTPNPTKQHLLQLYQQSVINPQARKLLLSAICNASVMELEKFIANQAVDQEMEVIVVREIWGRGIVPSNTSISRSSRYYGRVLLGGKGVNVHLSEALKYKRIHTKYSSPSLPTPSIPSLPKPTIQKLFLSCLTTHLTPSSPSSSSTSPISSISPWRSLSKLCLQPINILSIIEVCLYLSLDDDGIVQKMEKNGGACGIQAKQVRMCILEDFVAGWVRDRMGLRVLFRCFWDWKAMKVVEPDFSEDSTNTTPILQYLLKQPCLLDKILTTQPPTPSPTTPTASPTSPCLPHQLWQYFQDCNQFQAHENLSKQNQSIYPYYQVQETLQLDQMVVGRIVDRLFAARVVVGGAGVTGGSGGSGGKESMRPMEVLLMVLVYLDPRCFQVYFRAVVDKISTKLSQILKKQHKILLNFQSTYQPQSQPQPQPPIQMQKQYKYWNLHCSKSTQQHQQHLDFFRNILVDISTNLLQKFKKMRFNYHCGKNYRQWRLEIEILREKLLTCGSLEGLVELEGKESQLEDWRRNQSNFIINGEILPIVESNSENFIKVLMEAEDFLSEFLDTFPLKQSKQKIVIFSNCAKIYQILLACDILTHQQKITYHSMSKLKTTQSLQSSKGMNTGTHRKSSLLSRKSARISINPSIPKVQHLLKKIGPKCTYLNQYIGQQEPIRQLHAKYSDVNKRLKIMWANGNGNFNQQGKNQKEKVIMCRRGYIIQDTLAEIDQDFVNLPVKIKFQGEIGIDYGGVTREWITLFMKQIINPDLGLFSLSANKLTFQPNPNSNLIPNHIHYFRKIGIIIGKAMKQNWLLQVNLTKSFLKHILGYTLYVEDLQDIDPQTAKSLKWILENDIGEDDGLGINFVYERDRVGRKQVVEMVSGGLDIPVTESNKKNYVKLLANIKMTEQIREQSKAFMNGLQSVIPYSTLQLFSYKEISLYLSGMPTIDIKEMQETARYENITPESQEVVWFWKILKNWSQEELANFLFFLTGSYKVPYGGFKEHPIGLNKMPSCQDYLPVAHTCFSVIDISSYSSQQKMSRLLKKSIKQGKGFSVS